MRALAIFVAIATVTLGQTKAPRFEVASIRPAIPDESRTSRSDRERFAAHNLTLNDLISLAYDVDAEFISGGPGWVNSDTFDINAKVPAEFARHMTVEREQQMIQDLLTSRFRLAVHRETRQIAGYALTVAANRPKLKASTASDENSHISTDNAHLTATNATMEGFAKHLSHTSDVGKPVVDQTGLTGRYNFALDWAPENDRLSIFTALQEQLGLKLVAANVPVLAVVIDRAERPVSN